MGYKEPRHGEPQNSVRDANVAGFSKSWKYISDNPYEVSDFPTEDKTSLRLVQPDTDRKK